MKSKLIERMNDKDFQSAIGFIICLASAFILAIIKYRQEYWYEI